MPSGRPPSTPWKRCPGLRIIYTGSIFKDRTKARIILSKFPFPALLILNLDKISTQVAVDIRERVQYNDHNGIREEVFEPYIAHS